ncbi:MAG: hypothetical protein U0031_00050 [Thermomicrobiales bacterium]
MDRNRFDTLTRSLGAAPYRRAVLRSLGVAGVGLLTALGVGETSATSRSDNHPRRDAHQSRRRTRDRAHAQPVDAKTETGAREAAPESIPAQTRQEHEGVHADQKRKGRPTPGPTGPTGPTGPAGAVGATLPTRRVSSGLSNALPVTAGASVGVTADCEGIGKVVSCGYLVSVASPAQLVNTLVNSVEPNDDRSGCVVQLRRTAEAGSTAGAQIIAKALCLV